MTEINSPPDQPGQGLAKLGAWLQLCPFIGAIGTVIGMIRSFAELSTSTEGVGDPSVLSAAIGEVLIASYLGLLGSLVGCVLLGLAIWRHGFKAGWALCLFSWSVIPSLLALWMTSMLVRSAMHPPGSPEAQRSSEVGR